MALYGISLITYEPDVLEILPVAELSAEDSSITNRAGD